MHYLLNSKFRNTNSVEIGRVRNTDCIPFTMNSLRHFPTVLMLSHKMLQFAKKFRNHAKSA